jgi:hypothetical protein
MANENLRVTSHEELYVLSGGLTRQLIESPASGTVPEPLKITKYSSTRHLKQSMPGALDEVKGDAAIPCQTYV